MTSAVLIMLALIVLRWFLSSTTIHYTKTQRSERTTHIEIIILVVSIVIIVLLQLQKHSKRTIIFIILLLINIWWLYYKRFVLANYLPYHESIILGSISAIVLVRTILKPQKGRKLLSVAIVTLTVIYWIILLPDYNKTINPQDFLAKQTNTIKREKPNQQDKETKITITDKKTQKEIYLTEKNVYQRTGENYQISYTSNSINKKPTILITHKGIIASIAPQSAVVFADDWQNSHSIKLIQGEIHWDSASTIKDLKITLGETEVYLPTPCFTKYNNTVQTISFTQGSWKIIWQSDTIKNIQPGTYVQWIKDDSVDTVRGNPAIEDAKKTYNIQRERYLDSLNNNRSKSSIGYDIIKFKLLILKNYDNKYNEQRKKRYKLGCLNHNKDCEHLMPNEKLEIP